MGFRSLESANEQAQALMVAQSKLEAFERLRTASQFQENKGALAHGLGWREKASPFAAYEEPGAAALPVGLVEIEVVVFSKDRELVRLKTLRLDVIEEGTGP